MDPFVWQSESDAPRPARLTPVDDRVSAEQALRRIRGGEVLLYEGDFRNARQLLAALARRLAEPASRGTPAEIFRAERAAKERAHDALSKLVVALDATYRLPLPHAPDVSEACAWAWGPAPKERTVVPLKTLLGVLGAAEWRRKGLAVPGLKGTLEPHYGVYTPTRTDYVELLANLDGLQGQTVFDVGTGTGVLGFLLLQQGASAVTGTDVDPRAVACANANAARLGYQRRFTAVEADLFPAGRANWVVCNPPWIPEAPKTRLDRAVFDAGSAVLSRFVAGLPAHLEPGGTGLLVMSNLAVLLGLRPSAWLREAVEAAGLRVAWTREAHPRHSRAKDTSDPLHAVRSREVTSLYALTRP